MKKKILFLMIFFFTLLLVGCGKYGEDDAIKDFKKKIDKADSYRVTGTLEITNTIDTSDSTKLILMLCLSILITAILAAIIYSKAFTGTAKENASDSAIIGKCTYRFKLTKNKITYIRSCK